MNETDKGYWLLSETSGIGETRDPRLQRNLPLMAGLGWLSAGWRSSISSRPKADNCAILLSG